MKYLSGLLLIATVSVLFTAACSPSAGQEVSKMLATLEDNGYNCEVKERIPKKAESVSQCRSKNDKYQMLIVSKWHDRDGREALYREQIPADCSRYHIKEKMRWSRSGDWFLVAGGSTDKDARALQAASKLLGFDYQEAPCQ